MKPVGLTEIAKSFKKSCRKPEARVAINKERVAGILAVVTVANEVAAQLKQAVLGFMESQASSATS